MMAEFKRCTVCMASWADRESFLSDPGITLVGYQASFIDLRAGLFLFNHSCGDTLAIQAEAFEDLYSGPVFRNRKSGQPGCPGYCLNKDELSRCPEACECAYVRAVLEVVRKRLERTAGEG